MADIKKKNKEVDIVENEYQALVDRIDHLWTEARNV